MSADPMYVLARYLADVWPVGVGDLNEADRILSALSAAGYAVEQGWQPIETAPKDDWMYVWHAKHKWLRIGRKFGGAGPRWYFSGHVPGGAQYGDGDEAPTHWRPLPAAPQEGHR